MRCHGLPCAGVLSVLFLAGACEEERGSPETCGNGLIEGQEQCDLTELGGRTCATLTGAFSGGDLACTSTCTFDTSGCIPRCGNGVYDLGEACDDGPDNSDTEPDACRTSCRLPSCGDGVTDASLGEACDAGLYNSDTEPDVCRTSCQPPTCGDGVEDRAAGEQCDAGALNAEAPDAACRTSCLLPACGDGIVDGLAGEQCDGAPGTSQDCGSLGAGLGKPACTASCELDRLACVTCGNGVCDDWEGFGLCPADCAATAVSLAWDHACAILVDGSAWCWGANEYGQLGDGTHTASLRPVRVAGLNRVVAIDAGDLYTCAVTAEGTAGCWGFGELGELGNGISRSSSTPVQVSGLTGVVAISAPNETYWPTLYGGPGGHRTCAVKADGTVWCWGLAGQYGPTPVQVAGLEGVTGLVVSTFDACVVRADGPGSCWGDNTVGQLGNGTTLASETPVHVLGLTDLVQVVIGGVAWPESSFFRQHVALTTCALDGEGGVWCWGANDHGQLGYGAERRSCETEEGRIDCSPTPVRISGIARAVSIGASANDLCALQVDGTVSCWGIGISTQVRGLTDVVDLGMGGDRACAIKAEGSVWCWRGDEAPEPISF